MVGFFKRLFGRKLIVTPGENGQMSGGRIMSDVEAQVRVRNLLNSERYHYRTLGRLARAIGRDKAETAVLLASMSDVRPSRDNCRRPCDKALYTFAE